MPHWPAVGIIDLARTAESGFLTVSPGSVSPQFNRSLVVFLNEPVGIAGVHRYRNQIEQSFVALLACAKFCFGSSKRAQINDGRLVEQRAVFHGRSDWSAQKNRWNLFALFVLQQQF